MFLVVACASAGAIVVERSLRVEDAAEPPTAAAGSDYDARRTVTYVPGVGYVRHDVSESPLKTISAANIDQGGAETLGH